MGYAERAVDFNRFNIEALQLQALISRCQNDRVKAEEVLKTILSYDPLNRIVSFQPRIDNTVRNFTPANTLVTAWALERLKRKNEAGSFINRQISDFPDYKDLLWSKALFENDKEFILPENEKDANVRIIEQLRSSGI